MRAAAGVPLPAAARQRGTSTAAPEEQAAEPSRPQQDDPVATAAARSADDGVAAYASALITHPRTGIPIGVVAMWSARPQDDSPTTDLSHACTTSPTWQCTRSSYDARSVGTSSRPPGSGAVVGSRDFTSHRAELDDSAGIIPTPARSRPDGRRYRLDELLGRSGACEVHRASRHPAAAGGDRQKARPLLPADVPPRGSGTRQAVRLATASLSHHNLVPLLDYQRIDNGRRRREPARPDHGDGCRGSSLRRRLCAGAPLTIRQAAYLGFDLAEAFEHLHETGHRAAAVLTSRAAFSSPSTTTAPSAPSSRTSAAAVRTGDPTSVTSRGRGLPASAPAPEQLRGEPASPPDRRLHARRPGPGSPHRAGGVPGPVARSGAARRRTGRCPTGLPAPPSPTSCAQAHRDRTRSDRPAPTELWRSGSGRPIAESSSGGTARSRPHCARPATRRHASPRCIATICSTPRPEGAFDLVTTLGPPGYSHMPVSTVSIVDRERIWFKSHFGLEGGEIARDPGLCATVVHTGSARLRPGRASGSERPRGNPLIAGDLALQSLRRRPPHQCRAATPWVH